MKNFLTCLAYCLLLSNPLYAANTDNLKVALVLGGGGAKGIAHIGVLKALEEAEVEVDIITGTSMGAIIGGFYASGLTVEEIEAIVTGGQWEKGFSDLSSRTELPMELKQVDHQELTPFEFGITSTGSVLPQGMLEGQNILAVFREVLPDYWRYKHFDFLPIPFRAVATDVTTGKAYVLKEGDLSMALRASMSIPGMFSPVKYQGKLLVDGGIANNLPVDLAKEMGADIVIAVDVGSKARTEEELNSFLTITEQLITLMTARTTEEQIKKLGPKDILIRPDITNLSTLDFSNLALIEELGYNAMAPHARQIAKLKTKRFKAPVELQTTSPVVSNISFANPTGVSDIYLRSRIRQQEGSPLDLATIEEDIQTLYARKLFKQVRYEVNDNEDGTVTVEVITEQLPRDLSYLQVGMGLSSSIGKGDSNSFNISTFYRQDMLNKHAGAFEALVKLGDEIDIRTSFHQPFNRNSDWFIEPFSRYHARDIYDSSVEQHANQWWLRTNTLGVDLGVDVHTRLQARVGLQLDDGSFNSEYLTTTVDSGEYRNIGYRFELIYDSLDTFNLPRDGWLSKWTYTQYDEALGSDYEFEHYQTLLYNYNTWERHTLGLGLHWEAYNDAPNEPPYFTQLGGFKRLSGFSQNAVSGNQGYLAVIDYRYRLDNNLNMPISVPMYLGATIEAGDVWEQANGTDWENFIFASSVYLALDSPVGPIHLAYGQAEGNHRAVYLVIGSPNRVH